MKKVLKAIIILLLAVIVLAGGLLAWLTIAEYNPADEESLEIIAAAKQDQAEIGKMYNLVSFNTGYAGLSKENDFFMDGGTMVRPESKEMVEENANAILSAIKILNPDICFLQEVDLYSYRSYYTDQMNVYRHGLSMNCAFAYNYKCEFVPFPWPPLRKVQSGLLTFTNFGATEAKRVSLPVPFTWPVRVANLKRCLLVERIPVSGTDHELVLINLHLEAYEPGEGRVQQTKKLMSLISDEYAKGNYVVVGGDFNQSFEDAKEFPDVDNGNGWSPIMIANSDVADGFSFAIDTQNPTCRSLAKPYDGDRENTRFYIIDGFIVSDNIKVNSIETIDLNFRNSDHNPVQLHFTLQ